MSKVLWTSKEAAEATGGKAVGEWSVYGLSIDTRSLKSGDLFVPLKDARDGHDFIPQARTAGAGAVLSERDDEDAPALIVGDSVEALRQLGLAARKRCPATRIGVTGSVGKTSLKEAIYAICTTQGASHKSLKSFNNHWGVPLTLATMPRNTKFGVFELGMNHAGELADLSPLVAPNIAVITKIAPAHLAHFNSVDDIAAAKAEILEGVVAHGIAILNADDHYFDFLSNKARQKDLKIISFGMSDVADVRVANMRVNPGQISADIIIDGKTYPLSMPLDGEHWIMNAACAIAATREAGIDTKDALAALAGFGALPGRGERIAIDLNGKSITLIDESYNANPESMRAAISSLGSAKGRKLAVLGDMYELGADELSHHAALAAPLKRADVKRVIVVGECMRALRGALPQDMRGAWAASSDKALLALENDIHDGDTILVKGSNATGLSNLVEQLKKHNNKKEAAHVV